MRIRLHTTWISPECIFYKRSLSRPLGIIVLKIIHFTTHLYTLSKGYLVNFVSLLEQVSGKLAGFDVMWLEKHSITDLQLGTGAVEFCVCHCSSILITQQLFYGTHLHVAI
jgi:hypothetical protein